MTRKWKKLKAYWIDKTNKQTNKKQKNMVKINSEKLFKLQTFGENNERQYQKDFG